MIISERHKFIFVAIPKTGTHSVRRALRPHLGDQDLEQVRLFEEKSFPVPALARLGHGHITLGQLRPFVDPAKFDSLFKFAFVRNPFDRFVSYCAFITREQRAFDKDPKAVMRQFASTAATNRHILFQPQHIFVTGAGGELLTDYVGRVEQMQQCYDEICDRIGIETTELEKANVSQRGDYRQYYDAELIDSVARVYSRDLELFGYEF